MCHQFQHSLERRWKNKKEISWLKFNMHLYFSQTLRLMSICDFDKWSIKTEKNDIGRMKDSHYWEQADVFFAYRVAGFHQTLLIMVCTLVFLQFSPLTFIWSMRFCIKYIVIALLLPSLWKCMPACRVERQLNERGVYLLFKCRRKR